jgi:segregation and condensation protein A
MEADYKVKLEVFEGPLDLLLYLIKQDEIDIYDVSLERITRQYLEYLQAATELHLRQLEQERIFARESSASSLLQEPLRLEEVGIFQLINAFQTVLKRIEARQDLQEIFGERFSVSEKIDIILQRVANGARLRFSDLFGDAVSRVEVVVTFLALLELIRLKQVCALQKNMFEEIEIAAAA